jgi:DNA (cytosine-5)-methyltransferase 1
MVYNKNILTTIIKGFYVEEYRFIDLFAGAGGLSTGLEQAGFSVKFANEINKVCAETYLKNRRLNPENMFVDDIAKLNGSIEQYSSKFKNTFLVAGGPPCQGFSMANRQRIVDDPRNQLYVEYLKFLQHVRPSFFIMENVKGMLNKIDEILDDFHKRLGNDYDISYKLLKAKDYSVPQNRQRLIIIGNRINIKSSDVFTKMESFSQKLFVLGDAIVDLPELKPNRVRNNSKRSNDEIGYFERDYKYTVNEFNKFINNNRVVEKLYNHKNRFNNDRDIEIYSRLPQGANSLHESIVDIMPYASRNHMFKDKYFKLDNNAVCKTITSHMQYDCNMYIHPTQFRGLSPREAARVQTFPDDYIFYGPQNKWYMQIGNAVPVKLAENIGRAIIECVK